ncbi:MAG: 2-iminoacetate synthase ThiH [Candidatus Omnitrophota bacterium]
MDFYEIYTKYKDFDAEGFFASVTDDGVRRALQSEVLDIRQYLTLLSPLAENYLEDLAQKAHTTALLYFGRAIQLYTPLYLSNYCENGCQYCGFNAGNDIERKKLTLEEVEEEARFISSSGLKHILVLTGESRAHTPLSYIKECIPILRRYFSSISVEIYPVSSGEYAELIALGVDGLTIYQETYDRAIYEKVHPFGPKRDFLFRLGAPERAAEAGMRTVNIGALLGLGDWRRDAFFTGLHARYLFDRFSAAEVSVSVPRLRKHTGEFKAYCETEDKNIVQIILALRAFLPRTGLTLSTRESAGLRDNLIPLGITKMSAWSTTRVGGHTRGPGGESSEQFEVKDGRTVDEIKRMLIGKKYQPVMKDWMAL